MLRREEIAQEIWNRLSNIVGVQRVARNPENPPDINDLPTAQFFELDDVVTEMRMRGNSPAYKRELTIVIEVFVAGSSEAAASKELMSFVKEMKSAFYSNGNSLSNANARLGLIQETEQSRILRPGVGSHVAGIGTVFKISYTEDSNNY